jgi:elongation factor G
MGVTTEQIRNVALVGHNGSGKTSLVEAMLFEAGLLSRLGRVEDANTVSDSDPEEQRRGQSLSMSVISFSWNGHRVNVIDTPGYADFLGDALASLRAADLALFVLDGMSGVQAQDEVLWREARRLRLPRFVFINKLDHEHVHYDDVVAQVRQRFGSGIEPVELPIGEESSFHGVADLLTERAYVYDSGHAEETDLPEEMAEREHAEHDHLVEDVVESDEALLERYLEGDVPSAEELEHALHLGVDTAGVFPVLVGSATKHIGVDRLLEFVCRVGPAPGEAGGVEVEAGSVITEVTPDPAGQPLAFVFKTKADDYLGQVSYVKVLSGRLRPDDTLTNTRTHGKERIRQLLSLSGSTTSIMGEAVAGDIVGLPKLSETRTGDTLAPDNMPVKALPLRLPAPVYGVAVKARSQAQDDKLGLGLQRLQLEDPSLVARHDDETNQTVLWGSGEVHLQVALGKIERVGVALDTEEVRIPYRETLAGPADCEGKYKKQTGGHGQFGVVNMRFEPLPRGAGFEFVDEIVGGAIPKGLIPAVRKGVEEAMVRGGHYGYPVVDLRAVLYDGKHHPVDSSEMSFKMAGSLAFRAALDQGGIQVLEPLSEVEVRVPTDHQGDVMGDLNSRRGHVVATEAGDADDEVVIRAVVPAAEVRDYAIDLRSITRGKGRYSVTPHGYESLPGHLAGKLAPVADGHH